MDTVRKLRPHHGLCIHHFAGKGYSEAFTANMKAVIASLTAENPCIELISSEDVLCAACPHNQSGCVSNEKVQRFDREVLRLCEITPGALLHWNDFSALVQHKILDAGEFETVCADCEWVATCRALQKKKQ